MRCAMPWSWAGVGVVLDVECMGLGGIGKWEIAHKGRSSGTALVRASWWRLFSVRTFRGAVGSGLSLEAVGTPVFFSGLMNLGLGAFFSRSGRSMGGRCCGGDECARASVVAREEVAGVGVGGVGDQLGRAVRDDAATAFAALGAHVEEVVGVADDVEVVLDDDDGVAEVGEAVQDFEQLADVVEVEAGGGLVEEIEGAAGLALGELAGELHALGFAAGERGGGLAEMDVAEADVDEGLELAG